MSSEYDRYLSVEREERIRERNAAFKYIFVTDARSLMKEVDRLRAALAQAEAERDALRVRLGSWQDHLARVHHVACDWGLERLALPEDMSEEQP